MLHLTHLPEVDAVVADVDHLVAAGRAGSCRRSRAGSAARGGRGRPSPPAAPPGPAVVGEGVEGGPDRAAGEQHVVDQHDGRAVRSTRDVGDRLGQHRPQADVVAVEGDVERADRRRRCPRSRLRASASRCGERHAAGLQADQHDVVEAVVALDDLVGHAGDGPLHVVGRP